MKYSLTAICLTLVLSLGTISSAWSADYLKGLDAYTAGDYSTALHEWTPLATQGNADAQYNLGVMYRNGYGVPQNDTTAVKWYTLAAEQGDARAQFNLGQMYREGRGVPQDYDTAMKWYTLAAEQGDADAQYNLGLMYAMGKGVFVDYVQAHMWWSIAASSGKKNAIAYRDKVAGMMTPSQLEKAQVRARVCVRNKYKNC